MKLIQRYTDDYYANEYEIKNDLNVAGIHIILDEIENYRKQYRIFFYFNSKKQSIVLTPKIKKIMNTYYEYDDVSTLHPLIQIFLLRNQIESCKECIHYYHLSNDYIYTFNYIYSFESDITKSFLEWLEHLQNYSFIKMILYEYKIKQLSSKQQSFLLKNKDYFDIKQYQKELNISYETARLHLSFLNHQKMITRHKIGKKYVYKGDQVLYENWILCEK